MSDQEITLAGRYRLGRQIGSGGMADVYLAEDARLHRTVAVKILRAELARDANFQERFRREAQSSAGLNHPSIVAVYDTGEEHTTDALGQELTLPFIVMEYVRGRTLRELLDPDAPMQAAKVSVIMGSLLSALQYSHEMGIVHRDIKPGNVMITATGAVKVMDFGIARAVADSTAQMTQTQAVMGTAQYLSPEQARGQIVDARSDIYSAACVMYELLTGRPPFMGESPVSIAYQHVREQPVPPSRFNPEISANLDRVILTGLAKDREQRYPTASAFAQDISRVARGETPQLVPGAPSDPEATAAMAPVGDDATQALPLQGEPATEVLGRHQLPGTAAATVGGTALGTAAAPATASDGAPAAVTAPPAEQQVEDTKKRRSPIGVIVLVILALLALVGALLFFLRPWDTAPETIAVPDVVGATEDQARATLTNEGLQPQFEQVASEDVPEGTVVSTDPAAGTEVERSSTVQVAVSSGPDAVDVPDLVGMTEDEARAALEKAGLSYRSGGEETAEDAEPGQVVRTDPAAGDSVEPGSEVSVWLAPSQVEVPDVSGLSQEDAERVLTERGFTVDTVTRPADQDQVGTVLEQSPAAGEQADVGSTVNLIIAGEPGPATVPNVEGQTSDQAQQALSAEGFGVRVQKIASADVAEGRVIRTDPEANSEVDAGTTITIIVSTGPEEPAPSPSPSPTDSPSDSPSESPSDSPSETPTSAPPTGPGSNNGNGRGSGNRGNVSGNNGSN